MNKSREYGYVSGEDARSPHISPASCRRRTKKVLKYYYFFNMTCLSWTLQLVIVPLTLQLALLHIPVRATSRKCDTIYKGFADCLISLGDSMAQNVQQSRVNEEIDDAEELDSICKSWDDFHKCASSVLINCPEDTAAIWESLRKESRKIQYQGNLHDLCTSRNQQSNSMGAMDAGETNKETLRGLACMTRHSFLPVVIAPVLVWIVIEKAL